MPFNPPHNHHSHHFKDFFHRLNSLRTSWDSEKKQDLPSSKTTFKKTSGSLKPFSSSCLGLSSCRKSKAKATKHHKSSFKTSFKPSDSSYCSRSSSESRNRSLTSTKVLNGGSFHVFHDLTFCFLVAMSLFYLSALKLLHHPFDKEKFDLHAFTFKTCAFTKNSNMFQTSSSRNFLLCFNLRILKISTVCDPPHQLCGMFNFEFKLITLIRDLPSCFNKIVFENASSKTTPSSSGFLRIFAISSFLELISSRTR